MGPYDYYHPHDFFRVKAGWSARRNFRSVLFWCSHQATGPTRLDTAVHLWFGPIIRRTPCVPRAMPVRASHGLRTGISNVLHILRHPFGTRKGAVRHPYGHVRELTQPEVAKIPHGRRIWPSPWLFRFNDCITVNYKHTIIPLSPFFMRTSSSGNIVSVTGHLCGEFTGRRWLPRTRPVTRRFDVFFDLSLNRRLSKQSWSWWFEMPSCPLWRHCHVVMILDLWRWPYWNFFKLAAIGNEVIYFVSCRMF